MKKDRKIYETFWTVCSTCPTEIERDIRFKDQTVSCFDCKRKKLQAYKKRYDKHISELLKKFPFNV